MTREKFLNDCKKKHPEDYGICLPPTTAQDAVNALIEHFLGEGWYSTMPMSTEQINTQAVCEILDKYPEKKSIREKLADMAHRSPEVRKIELTEAGKAELKKRSSENCSYLAALFNTAKQLYMIGSPKNGFAAISPDENGACVTYVSEDSIILKD